MQENESFTKRTGTTDLGKDYEDLMVSNLSLQHVKNPQTEDFRLSSNHSEFGAFDDVVFEAGTNKKYALQLKHVKNPEKGSFKNQLSGAKGNFSIQKYFEEFRKIDENLRKLYNFVLFTTVKFDPERNATLTLSNGIVVKILKKEDFFSFLETKGNCFQFEIVGKANEEYTQFFQQFLLYTNQANVDEVRLQTVKLFREMFDSENELAEQFIKFISDWSKSEGKKRKLNRDFMRKVLAIILLGQTIKPLNFSAKRTNPKLDLLKSVIFDFDVTLFVEDSDRIVEIFGDLDKELPDFPTLKRTMEEYKLIPEKVNSIQDFDETTKSKLLWILNKYPLVVEANKSTSKAIELCPNHKFIIIGSVHPQNLKIFQKLTNLDPKTERYTEILKTFKCVLKDNKQITLEELFTRNDKIKNLLTSTDLLKMATESFKMSDVVTLLALSDPEINKMCQKNGYTPLHAACINGNLELIKLIIESDIDLNGASKDGDSPIILATLQNHYPILEILLDAKANPNAASARGDTALQMACTKRDHKFVKLLAEGGANVNVADFDGTAPLQVAATNGDLDIVKVLLDFKANFNASNKYGESALYLACLNGHAEIVRILVGLKAKFTSNEAGNGPLHAAALKGHAEVVRVLLELCPNVVTADEESDSEDDDGHNGGDAYFVNKNSGNANGNTPLHLAAQKGHVNVVRVLVEFGADLNIGNGKGATPLDLAKQKEHSEIVGLLNI